MRDKGPVWNEIVARHKLRPTALHDIALWAYGNYQIRPQWDVTSSMAKARALGFEDRVDSTDCSFDSSITTAPNASSRSGVDT